MDARREPTTAPALAAGALRRVPLSRGLSTRLLLLTIVFVLVAEVLIFVPSLANFRLRYLQDRLNTARVAAAVLGQDGAGTGEPRMTPEAVLRAADAVAIVERMNDATRLLFVTDMPEQVDQVVDPTTMNPVAAIGGAFSTLMYGGGMTLRVLGDADASGRSIELIMTDSGLRAAMFTYARNVAFLALAISLITAVLLFSAVNILLIRPVRALTRSMLAFSADPADPANIIAPSDRADELGVATRELGAMQNRLRDMLSQQSHLADLGLAVSKINHDMRNVLASAQLMSDRLPATNDPAIRSFAPKLMRALDRAVAYTEGVLAYGRTQEPPPRRRRLRLRALVDEAFELVDGRADAGIDFVNTIDAGLEIDADPDQLFRIVTNLCRNAVQAMAGEGVEPSIVSRLTVAATREAGATRLSVCDTGPGLPEKARENLFAAFRGSARAGGTGLGLAIARELVRAHGGDIALVESRPGHTEFAFVIPDDGENRALPGNGGQ